MFSTLWIVHYANTVGKRALLEILVLSHDKIAHLTALWTRVFRHVFSVNRLERRVLKASRWVKLPSWPRNKSDRYRSFLTENDTDKS